MEILDSIPIRESTADIDGMDSIDFLDMILDSLSDLDNLSKTSFDDDEQDVISVGDNGELRDTTFDLLDVIMDEHHQDVTIEDHNVIENNTIQDNAIQNGTVTINTNAADQPTDSHPSTTTTTTMTMTTSILLPTESMVLPQLEGESTDKMNFEALNHLPVPLTAAPELTSLQQGKRQLLSHFLCHLTDSGAMAPLCLSVVCTLGHNMNYGITITLYIPLS